MISRKIWMLLAVLLAIGCGTAMGSGSETHRSAAQYAARLSAEPFKSGWEDCFGAMVPDQMLDQPLGHENHRAAGMLYTHEAIRYLREKQYKKALFLASVRSHYLVDSMAIPHCDVWKPRSENDVMVPGQHGLGVWSFLPKSVQAYQLPFEARPPGKHYDPLLIDPPPMLREVWDGLAATGSMHAFFDRTPFYSLHEPWTFPLDNIPDTTNWSCYDFEIVARWHGEQIALEMVDRDSVLAEEGRIRFSDAQKMQKAFDHEMENDIAAIMTYYRYLGVAADTEMTGDIDSLLPSIDRLVLMARQDPVIYISDNAPWPLRRTCMLLAMEIVRAKYRAEGDLGLAYSLGLKEACEAIIQPIEVPEGEDDKRILVAWETTESEREVAMDNELNGNNVVCAKGQQDGAHILLRGKDLQSTVHLIDYLLDLSYAPLIGRAPVEVLFNVFEEEWDGITLIEDLKVTPEEDVASRFAQVTRVHSLEPDWALKVHSMIWPYAKGTDIALSGVLPRFWNLFILDLPQPDGTLVDLNAMTSGTEVPLPSIFDIPVVDGSDDAEQKLADGTVRTGSSDLEIVDDNLDFGMQTVGVRFQNVPLIAGHTISNAYIQFTADPVLGDSISVTFTIQGEAADHSGVFTTEANNISSRTKTTASVSWSPAAWTAGAEGTAEQTADVTPILNEIVSRPGWRANNAISFIFSGASGTRRAESYEGGAAKAPVLHIEYDGDVVNNDIRFGSTIVKGPYPLYKNSPNTMQIIWQTVGAEGGTIQWGSTSTYGQSAVPISLGNNMYACTITGLQADQKVYYRVNVDGDYSSSFFYTAPDAATTHVTLYAGGDSRSNPAGQNSCFGAMLADMNGHESSRNTIMIYSGNMVYSGGTESDWANTWFGRWYPNSLEAQSRVPIAAGVGDREMVDDADCSNFRKYYPYDYEDDTGTGQNGCYYAYEYGPALILVIDLEQGCAVGSAQYNWVVNELKNSTQAFKIAVYHEPAYSAGGDHADSEARMVQAREVLAPLFAEYECLLAISGHNHYYNRSLVNGIHHITSGGLGALLATPGDAIGQEAVEKVRHLLRIECDKSTGVATVTVIREDGTVLETFNVQYTMISDGSPNSAQYISNTGVPTQMIPGQSATVSITMKNTGTDTWSAANGHSLGTTSDNNFWVPGSNRIPLPKTVAPRQSVTFSFNITAPSTNGTYDFQWQMVDDAGANIGWFGDYSTNVAVTVGAASQATTAWSSVTGTDHWTDDVNWSGGVVPQDPYQNLRVDFNVEGAQECILDTRAVIRQLALGDNGTSNGISLRLSSGADLVCGAKPEGGTEWTSIGYNRPSTLTMEAGAVFEVAADLLIGFNGTGDSRLDIDGGLVNVNATITLGNVANTSHGFVSIDEGGRLDASGLTFNNTNCVVDVWKGSVVLAGDQTSAVNGYIATGNLIAYGGVGQLEADYNLSHSDFTTISATASGYDVWAAEQGIGVGSDDDDGDSRGNFYEYVMRGNPTDALDRGFEPFLLVQNGELIYAHIHRNDDPDLVYSLESTTNLVAGIWTDAVYTVAGAIFSFGGYDVVINRLQADDEPAYIRLKVEAP